MPIADSILEILAAIAKVVEKKTLTRAQAAKVRWREWKKKILHRYTKMKDHSE